MAPFFLTCILTVSFLGGQINFPKSRVPLQSIEDPFDRTDKTARWAQPLRSRQCFAVPTLVRSEEAKRFPLCPFTKSTLLTASAGAIPTFIGLRPGFVFEELQTSHAVGWWQGSILVGCMGSRRQRMPPPPGFSSGSALPQG